MLALPDEIDLLVAKDKIRSVLIQYCRAADRRDLEALKDVYWLDAVDDHGMYQGDAHLFCEMNVKTASEICVVTQHMLTNMDCRVDGDRAYVESYVLAYHKVVGTEKAIKLLMDDVYAEAHASTEAQHDCLTGGQYFDHFERRDGEWKILNRIAKRDWGIGRPSSLTSSDKVPKWIEQFGIDLSSAKNCGPFPAAYRAQ
jgi:hypothetical protein